MSDKIVLGITGPTGAGKTIISRIFEQHGFYIIDADIIARNIIDYNNDCKNEIIFEFGSQAYDKNQKLNRNLISNIVFNDGKKLEKLNKITFKYIKDCIINIILKCNTKYITIDAALLFESGLDNICNKTLAVLCDKSLRLKRIVKRDGISSSNAQLRINSQNNDNFYLIRSDYSIFTDRVEDINNVIFNIISELKYIKISGRNDN